MKLYFSGAIAQKAELGTYYEKIVRYLEQAGHIVLQDTTLVTFKEAVQKSDAERIAYYQHVLTWINQADAVVLEVSFPSTLHIGHELSLAIEKNKPVLALYHYEREPSFFLGLQHERVYWADYTDWNISQTLEQGLNFAQSQSDSKFNFSLKAHQATFLDNVAKQYNMPKSSYLRQLIEDDIKRRK